MTMICSVSFTLGQVILSESSLLGPVNPSVPAQGKGDGIFTSCHPGHLTTMDVIKIESKSWPFFRKRLNLTQAAIQFCSHQKAFQEHLASYTSSAPSTQEKKKTLLMSQYRFSAFLNNHIYVAP